MREQPLSDLIDWSDREYIIQDRDGDYLEKIEGGNFETVRFFFHWTADRKKARVFTTGELWAKGDTVCMMLRLAMGFAGVAAIRVK